MKITTVILTLICFMVSCGGGVDSYGAASNDVAYTGDDIILNGQWNNRLDQPVDNLAIQRATTQTVLNQVPEIIARGHTEVFIMVGLNDFVNLREGKETVLIRYLQIIDGLTEAGIIVNINSVLYIAREIRITSINSNATNLLIEMFNVQLEAACKQRGVTFLDINNLLSGDGFLEEGYSFGGMLLNNNAYMTWAGLLNRL